MAGSTPRYAIHYPSATDATNIPADLQTSLNQIDAVMVTQTKGVFASIPTAGILGRRYLATDKGPSGGEYVDTGTAWLPAGTINSSAGNVGTSAPGDTASAGALGVSADVAHRHAREARSTLADLVQNTPTGAVVTSGKWVDAAHSHPDGQAIGDIKYSVTGVSSANWMLADGSAISRSTYNLLYNSVPGGGAFWPFGQGDGVSTYNLPNLQDVVLVGAGGSFNVGPIAGTANTQTLLATNLPPHKHILTDPGHAHTIPGSSIVIGIGPSNNNSINSTPGGTSGPTGVTFTPGVATNTTGITMDNGPGASTAITTMQRSVALKVMIKVL